MELCKEQPSRPHELDFQLLRKGGDASVRAHLLRPAAVGYKTGTSARARAGTRVHHYSAKTAWSPGKMCPIVPASGRVSPTCLSLVMKGSAVRVRASASLKVTSTLLRSGRLGARPTGVALNTS
jgi:hypothetical protein